MDRQPTLLPPPRTINFNNGTVSLSQNGLIALSSANLFFEGKTAQTALADISGLRWEIVVGLDYPNTHLQLIIDLNMPHPQGYTLTVGENSIQIRGADAAGVFYGVCTLRQLLQQYGNQLPQLSITDWPDFPARGVMLDISRDKVPTVETLKALIERLAGWKINQIQLYMEHTFAYRSHPEVWAEASPLTGEDILELDMFCKARHVELVPNQNSLGHMERWLKHERYLPLAECPEGFEPPWGGHSPATTLNPLDPGSIELIASLYNELLPHFSSQKFNIGGDEPWELGKGKSKTEVEARGGRVYLDYLLKLHAEVTRHGRQAQFWADIILHYPELVPELPKDIMAMIWGYEGGEAAAQTWDEQCGLVAAAGVPFYVCPGTSSWNSIGGRTDNTIDNCRITAQSGLKHGAIGYLNTDWGDNGHWQPLSISYLGFAAGAGAAWCIESSESIDLPRALDLFAFEDRAGIMGKLAYELGNVYKMIGPEHINGQVLATTLQTSEADLKQAIEGYANWGGSVPNTHPDTLRQVTEHIASILQLLEKADLLREDAALIKSEFQQAAELLRHGARRLLLLQGDEEFSPAELHTELVTLVERHRANWLARNNPGGLEDSAARFDKLLDEYKRLES